MKTCRLCRAARPAEDFLAGKAKRPSSACADCRRRRANAHRRRFFAGLSADKRHELTHKRRAAAAGVGHAPYSRTEILVRWGGRCAYCDALAEHLDHVTALSRGGDDVESNILPACAECNLSKGAKTLAEWALTDPNIHEIGGSE
jgi:5-methylcytosine-specific restriction endonuclease McrA